MFLRRFCDVLDDFAGDYGGHDDDENVKKSPMRACKIRELSNESNQPFLVAEVSINQLNPTTEFRLWTVLH